MIEMLIKDNDTHITDIIREAFDSNESIRTSPDLNYEDSTIFKENVESKPIYSVFEPSINKKEAKISLSNGHFSSSRTTNVWQERAANREMRNSN